MAHRFHLCFAIVVRSCCTTGPTMIRLPNYCKPFASVCTSPTHTPAALLLSWTLGTSNLCCFIHFMIGPLAFLFFRKRLVRGTCQISLSAKAWCNRPPHFNSQEKGSAVYHFCVAETLPKCVLQLVPRSRRTMV